MAIRDIADILQIESVPLSERHLPTSTYAAINQQAKRTPGSPALTFFLDGERFKECKSWTYRDLFADITRAANLFTSLGVTSLDVVAFILPNLPETHFTIWGGEAAGITMAINPMLDGAQIRNLLSAARAKVIVTLAPSPGTDLWQKISAQLDGLPHVEAIAWVNMARYVPLHESSALRLIARTERRRHPNRRIVDFARAMRSQPADTLISGRVILPTDRSSYFCTGGTTGSPKIACRTHRSEVFDTWAAGQVFGPREKRGVYFCGLPLFHANGQLVTGLLPWSRGDEVILGTPQGYRGNDVMQHFWKIVDHYRVQLFSAVPTVLAALLEQSTDGADISSLEYAMCGAAPMAPELFRKFEKKTGIKILEGYGLTEGACVSTINPPDGDRRIGSVGLRLPYQPLRVAILDEEGKYERDAGTNEIGTVLVQGPNVFDGYLHSEHERSTWVGWDGQKWLNTGDLGRQDADGYIWLTGRKKELIIRSGHNIDPLSIEEPLLRHPDVQIAAAVGSPDPYVGEMPVAYVQLRAGANISEEALLNHARATIGERASWPKAIRFVDQMPQTAVGKLNKLALRNREIHLTVLRALQDSGLHESKVDVVPDQKAGVRVHITTDSAYSKSKAEELLAPYPLACSVSLAESGFERTLAESA